MLTRQMLEDTMGKVEKRALSNDAYAALGGAVGGAGLGALNWLLRPKDEDQRRGREFLTSVLSGAGLGAVAGYGLNQIPGLDIGKRVNYYRHPENIKAKFKDIKAKVTAALEAPPEARKEDPPKVEVAPPVEEPKVETPQADPHKEVVRPQDPNAPVELTPNTWPQNDQGVWVRYDHLGTLTKPSMQRDVARIQAATNKKIADKGLTGYEPWKLRFIEPKNGFRRVEVGLRNPTTGQETSIVVYPGETVSNLKRQGVSFSPRWLLRGGKRSLAATQAHTL